jgi:hypothetical protein
VLASALHGGWQWLLPVAFPGVTGGMGRKGTPCSENAKGFQESEPSSAVPFFLCLCTHDIYTFFEHWEQYFKLVSKNIILVLELDIDSYQL